MLDRCTLRFRLASGSFEEVIINRNLNFHLYLARFNDKVFFGLEAN